MSPPSCATAGRTRVSISSLICATTSEVFVAVAFLGLVGGALHQRQAAGEMLHHRAQDRGLEVLPVAVALGHRNEIGAEENAADLRDLEQRPAPRRSARRFRRWEIRHSRLRP